MGEGKRRRELLREKMLKDAEKWEFSPSPWEQMICEELIRQRVVIARRAPPEQITWMRMESNQCHANVRWYVKNDPSKSSRAVAGWWLQWPEFVLHSVIEQDGQFICITPSAFHEKEFPFIPDPKISWIEDGEVYSAVRDGGVIGQGVRAFPSYTIARSAIVRERLLAGVDPYKAIELSEDIMNELQRSHVDQDKYSQYLESHRLAQL